MTSNVFTKNEILKELANRGFFIDSYTLDTFFQKWKIEAIFEDEQGSEFFDKNALDFVMQNLFSQNNEEIKTQELRQVEPVVQQVVAPEFKEAQPFIQQEINQLSSVSSVVEDKETTEVLKNISLSDGTPLINKVQDGTIQNIQITSKPIIQEQTINIDEIEPLKIEEETASKGILESAMEGLNIENPQEVTKQESFTSMDEEKPQESNDVFTVQNEAVPYNSQNDFSSDNADFDDISLISESLEAQEKFKNYLVSELAKKNVDVAQKTNEFKLDISERTISMIARTMAKKIAKHVSMICSQDAKASAKLEDIQAKNEKLEQRAKELEEQNKKLRLLLAESNKNLNSYKPSMFGFYKKVNPQ